MSEVPAEDDIDNLTLEENSEDDIENIKALKPRNE